MTNETDIRECCAQIELIRQLITQPETFDLDKVLVKLETKKKLLMTFKPRRYITILEDLESGAIIHPGDWVKPPKEIEEKKVIKKPEEPKIDKKAIEVKAAKAKKEAEEKAILAKELQDTKDKLAELEALKELEKEEEAEIIGE